MPPGARRSFGGATGGVHHVSGERRMTTTPKMICSRNLATARSARRSLLALYDAENSVMRHTDDEQRWSAYMAAAHRGDARAYERLLIELASVIEAFVRSRFGALSFLEDCVQECLLAIHKARHTYNPARPFRPWLFAIVHNKTIDMLRRARVREQSTTELRDLRVEGADHGPEADAEAGTILLQLNPQLRDALTLTKIYGYSVSEAARRSGVSETAMKSRVSRAIKAVKSSLNSERARK
jgi:RNA polymerase sigma-70 factor (ECF subfamily)